MERTPEQAAEGAAIIDVLAAVLDRLVTSNAALALSDTGQITKFHALKAPGISIGDYLSRIYKFASCSNECFILALIYIDRLIQRNNFLLTELNVHRVVITATLLAAKFFDDAYYNNAYYARVGGVLVSEMNGLEVDFLFRINFSLHVTPELFGQYKDELVPAHLQVQSPNVGYQEQTIAVSNQQQQQQQQQLQMWHEQQQQQLAFQEYGLSVADAPSNDSTMAYVPSGPVNSYADAHGTTTRDATTNNALAEGTDGSTEMFQDYSNSIQAETDMMAGLPQCDTNLRSNADPDASSAAPAPGHSANPSLDNPANLGLNSVNINLYNQSQMLYQAGQSQHQLMQLQRANSLPVVPYRSHTGNCASQPHKPYSAPMVAMLPKNSNIGADQYLFLGNNLMPLQTTLIHHHHGIREQASFHQHANATYGIGRNLVAGHY